VLSNPVTLTCVFALGAVVGALLDHSRYRRMTASKRRGTLPASPDDLSASGDAKPHWGMKALVVTRDAEMVGIFSHLFRGVYMEVCKCISESDAVERLSSEKFEALVLDVDNVAESATILNALKETRPNNHLVVFAVASNEQAKETASAFPTFNIERPLVPSRIRDLLARVHGRMLRDRQAYFRVAVELPVSIRRGSGELSQSTTFNLSQSGMAITSPHLLEVGEQVTLGFAIPNSDLFVSAKGTVIWDDGHGKAGIHFECSSSSAKVRFFEWLHDQFFARFGIGSVESNLSRAPAFTG
jgi:PilZ domain